MVVQRKTRILKSRWFEKFARREGIRDATLVAAIERADRGLIDADLGAGLIKLRVFKQAARITLRLTQAQLDTEISEQRLFEVDTDAQNP